MQEEKTEKIKVVDTPTTASINPSVQDLIRQINTRVTDLSGLLRSQQDLLRKRGMNLPGGALDALRTLQTKLEALTKGLMNNQIELRQLRALGESSALINSSLELTEVLNKVMDMVVQLTGAERGYILLRDPQTNEVTPRVMRGMDNETLSKSDFRVSNTIVNAVFANGQPVLADNASADERYAGQHSIVSGQFRSILCVPLRVRDSVLGVVYCDNRIMSGLFKAHELELLTAFANQAAVAIENARLFESARAQLAEVTRVRDLIDNIFASIANGVITISSSGAVIACNQAGATDLGFDAPEQVIGQQIAAVFPPVDEQFADMMRRVYEHGTPETLEITPTVNGKGERIWNLIVSPLRDDGGQQQGLVIVLDDLTEARANEARLAQVRRYLPTAGLDEVSIENVADLKVEEREITAIFADVRGFTRFSERLEPEVLMQVINRYLDVASECISLQKGLVDKYMGDAVTGLFNTQLNPMEDHAVRCVRAGMTIIFDLLALHETMPEDQHLFYGIGIHTGPAVLGNMGGKERQEFGALGEATEICKVLQENAGKGEVIISEQTYEQVKEYFECEAFKPEKTKHYNITTAYKVLRRKKGKATITDTELLDLLKD
jgi:adenylate cyclase